MKENVVRYGGKSTAVGLSRFLKNLRQMEQSNSKVLAIGSLFKPASNSDYLRTIVRPVGLSVLTRASWQSSLAYSICEGKASGKPLQFLAALNESLKDDLFNFDQLVVSDPKNIYQHATDLLDHRESEASEQFIMSMIESENDMLIEQLRQTLVKVFDDKTN